MATLPPKAAGSGRLPLKFLALAALALLYFFLAAPPPGAALVVSRCRPH